jgi:hypothetical protein|tara:strand:- start:65 stop:445 length:381 start_codon:yes stop_codon:yes gene_type:complete
MTRRYAYLFAVSILATAFSAPITAQQEPTPSPTWETLLETVGGTGIHERSVWLFDVTDTDLAHLTELPALKMLHLGGTQVTAAGLVHFQKMPAFRHLGLSGYFSSDRLTDADIANLREALPTGGGA